MDWNNISAQKFDEMMLEIQKPEWDAARGSHIRETLTAGGSICGNDLSVGFGALFDIYKSHYSFGDRVRIGCYCYLGPGSHLRTAIILEDDVVLEPFVSITANQHIYNPELRCYKGRGVGRLIQIKRGARIETRSAILPGVVVGEGAIVRAGSVVTKSVPDYALAEGIPAKVTGYLNRTLNSGERPVNASQGG